MIMVEGYKRKDGDQQMSPSSTEEEGMGFRTDKEINATDKICKKPLERKKNRGERQMDKGGVRIKRDRKFNHFIAIEIGQIGRRVKGMGEGIVRKKGGIRRSEG